MPRGPPDSERPSPGWLPRPYPIKWLNPFLLQEIIPTAGTLLTRWIQGSFLLTRCITVGLTSLQPKPGLCFPSGL